MMRSEELKMEDARTLEEVQAELKNYENKLAILRQKLMRANLTQKKQVEEYHASDVYKEWKKLVLRKEALEMQVIENQAAQAAQVNQIAQDFERRIKQHEKKLAELRVSLTRKPLTSQEKLKEYRRSPLHQELEALKAGEKAFLENPSSVNETQGFFPVLKTTDQINAAILSSSNYQSKEGCSSSHSTPEDSSEGTGDDRLRTHSDSSLMQNSVFSIFETRHRPQSEGMLTHNHPKNSV